MTGPLGVIKKLADPLNLFNMGKSKDKKDAAPALTNDEKFTQSEARRAHKRNRRRSMAAEEVAVGDKKGL